MTVAMYHSQQHGRRGQRIRDLKIGRRDELGRLPEVNLLNRACARELSTCLSPVLVQSRSQSFVPLDQRSENESSGSIRFEITMGNNRILVIWFTAQSQSASISCYGACLKWLLPELSFSDRWSRGTKLWERDWSSSRRRRHFARLAVVSKT